MARMPGMGKVGAGCVGVLWMFRVGVVRDLVGKKDLSSANIFYVLRR